MKNGNASKYIGIISFVYAVILIIELIHSSTSTGFDSGLVIVLLGRVMYPFEIIGIILGIVTLLQKPLHKAMINASVGVALNVMAFVIPYIYSINF